MNKVVIKIFTRYCSYTNRVRWANSDVPSCKFPTVYVYMPKNMKVGQQ